MIPKKIHYCWLSNDPLPEQFINYLNDWKEKLPDYEFVLWNFDRFDIDSSCWVREAFEEKKYAFAADYIRLFALYHNGGIYLDLDVEVIKSFDDLLDQSFILGYESDNKAIEGGIIGSEKGALWLADCLKYYENKHFINNDGTYNNKPLPYILFDIISQNHYDILSSVLPFDYLTAKSLSTREVVITSNTYCVHHFAGSWTTPLNRLKKRIKEIIGPNLTSFIVRMKRKVKGEQTNCHRVLIIGNFGYKNNKLDGQTIKTRQVYHLLNDKHSGTVDYFCSSFLRSKPYLMILLFYKLCMCKTVVLLYASTGGLQTMVPVISRLSRMLRKRILYIAIGSSQVECMEGIAPFKKKRDDLIRICREMDGFLVETHMTQRKLEEKYKFKNIELFPNFRYFDKNVIFTPQSGNTLRLVYMGRIIPEKGYDVACEFFHYIKGMNLEITLDFYGQIDVECQNDFLYLMDKYSEQGVRYKGVLKPEEITKTLRYYDVMVFPTRYDDGIPGTIIDGYIASLPVVATNWKYAYEIIEDNVTGFIVPYDAPQRQIEFNKAILKLYNDKDLLNQMKRNAFENRMKYSADAAWNVLSKFLEV